LHPDDRALLQNLARALLRLNRFDEAEGVLKSARERQLETPQMRETRFDLAFVRGDTTTMQQAVAAARGTDDEYDRTFDLGYIAAFGGRFRTAQEHFRDAAALASGRKRPPQYAGWALARLALSQASLGRCKEVPASVQRALAISKYPGVVRIAIWALVQCGLTTEARRLHDELTDVDSRDDATAGESVLEETHALILVGGHEPARALELLKASPNDQGFEHPWLRGQSLLAMKDGAAAAAEFRRVVENRGGGPKSVLWPLAHLGLGRALVLTGEVDEGRQRYQQFLEMWKDADADAPDRVAARREYQSLVEGGSRKAP
jgi:tetratricopeptide (TPR) repeat protein